ncbi:hypothetical protein FACS189490_12860 [Clostridia bacterium]|nr:hypothetical protein FACS189490_12860 [Clostridia bacterium]
MGFTWNGVHTSEIGLVARLISVPFLPEPKIVTEEAAGMDGFYDFSAFNPKGRVLFRDKVWEYKCAFEGSKRDDVIARIAAVKTFFANYSGVLTDDNFPEERYEGVITNRINLGEVTKAYYQFTVSFRTQPFPSEPDAAAEPDALQLTINSGGDGTFILPLGYTHLMGDFVLSIDWGDGTREEITQLPDYGVGVPHTFPQVNTLYAVSLNGDVTGATFDGDFYNTVSMFNFSRYSDQANSANKAKLIGINGSLQNIRNTQDMLGFQFGEFDYMFADCVNLKSYSKSIDDLMTQYPDNGAFVGVFSGCNNIIAPRTYAEIPDSWK